MFIVGGNQSAGGYEVDNSLRFNSPSADYLNHTNGTPTSDKKYTFSAWVKRSRLSHRGQFFRVINPSSTAYYTFLEFTSDDRLGFNDFNGTATNFETDDLFRDVSAWYHFVIKMDTTQATSTDRFKIFINGVDKTTGFSTGINYPSLNKTIIATSSGRDVNIGGDPVGSGDTRKFDGYMAEVVLLDGQALDATSFGEFDEDSGIWKPIDVSGLTFGNNGFYLPFENSAALGQDDSGNGNNFTLNNLTSIDQTTDTPTNNFCTMNPLITRSGTAATYSEGNLKVVWSHSVNVPTMGTLGVQSGKWYYESKMFWGSNSYIGITYDSTPTNTDVNGYLLRQTGQKYDAFTGSANSYTSALSSGDTVMIAFDADNGTLWFGVNGTWANSATQTEIENGTTTNAAFSSIDMSYIWLPMGKGGISSNARIEANFGNPIYTISSGNSDGKGYGNFEYTVPNGYYSWNTKNLAEYG